MSIGSFRLRCAGLLTAKPTGCVGGRHTYRQRWLVKSWSLPMRTCSEDTVDSGLYHKRLHQWTYHQHPINRTNITIATTSFPPVDTPEIPVMLKVCDTQERIVMGDCKQHSAQTMVLQTASSFQKLAMNIPGGNAKYGKKFLCVRCWQSLLVNLASHERPLDWF